MATRTAQDELSSWSILSCRTGTHPQNRNLRHVMRSRTVLCHSQNERFAPPNGSVQSSFPEIVISQPGVPSLMNCTPGRAPAGGCATGSWPGCGTAVCGHSPWYADVCVTPGRWLSAGAAVIVTAAVFGTAAYLEQRWQRVGSRSRALPRARTSPSVQRSVPHNDALFSDAHVLKNQRICYAPRPARGWKLCCPWRRARASPVSLNAFTLRKGYVHWAREGRESSFDT
ncbi:hypothetical protein PsYK624_049740 [Phanerochaete sordida]|uniref:Uncharacterized protein n=1 Tax=Phanerochaete sordida TaxID=48140 RepID=A0A9P3LCH5_9APHY|nr:hypothetical protein PsYK624_049740 [Phanerochaete sordida]